MYAIQAMSAENKIFPVSDLLDDTATISSLDEDTLSIIYEPDNSAYRSDRLNSQINDTNFIKKSLHRAKDIFSTDQETISTIGMPDFTFNHNGEGQYDSPLLYVNKEYENNLQYIAAGEPILSFKRKKQGYPLNSLKKKRETFSSEDGKRNHRVSQLLGHKVANDLHEYFMYQETKEIKLKRRPNLLPFTLSLEIYGISSIIPGDVFRVDYLPEIYKTNVYLQTVKVIQNIDSTRWTTTLETMFRPLTDVKKTVYEDLNTDNVFISSEIFKAQDLKFHPMRHVIYNHDFGPNESNTYKTAIAYGSSRYYQNILVRELGNQTTPLINRMTQVSVLDYASENFDLVFSFVYDGQSIDKDFKILNFPVEGHPSDKGALRRIKTLFSIDYENSAGQNYKFDNQFANVLTDTIISLRGNKNSLNYYQYGDMSTFDPTNDNFKKPPPPEFTVEGIKEIVAALYGFDVTGQPLSDEFFSGQQYLTQNQLGSPQSGYIETVSDAYQTPISGAQAKLMGYGVPYIINGKETNHRVNIQLIRGNKYYLVKQGKHFAILNHEDNNSEHGEKLSDYDFDLLAQEKTYDIFKQVPDYLLPNSSNQFAANYLGATDYLSAEAYIDGSRRDNISDLQRHFGQYYTDNVDYDYNPNLITIFGED